MELSNSSTGLRTSAQCLAAQNFTMPALSPTMTEGNIASWKVKEGDSFSAGDVLLEIETDKASMDVEAQDDGVIAKITQVDGSKGIKVGTRIGVIAEPGDDINSLEIPPEDNASPLSPKEEAQNPDPETSSESQAEAPPTSKSSSPSESAPKKTTGKPKNEKPQKQTYPHLPSVEHLIREHGLDQNAVDSINPSGPNNRLLKGDVLAYVGSIKDTYPSELSSKIAALSHLDLSNIKVASKPPPPPISAQEPAPEPPSPKFTDLELPIDMNAVVKTQRKLQRMLGTYLPVSTFVERATDLANDDLPGSKSHKPSSNELFDELLGLRSKAPVTVRGNLQPRMSTRSLPSPRSTMPPRNPDIIDILTGKKAPAMPAYSNSERSAIDTLIVVVPKGDEKQGKVFLERMKLVLEEHPGIERGWCSIIEWK